MFLADILFCESALFYFSEVSELSVSQNIMYFIPVFIITSTCLHLLFKESVDNMCTWVRILYSVISTHTGTLKCSVFSGSPAVFLLSVYWVKKYCCNALCNKHNIPGDVLNICHHQAFI